MKLEFTVKIFDKGNMANITEREPVTFSEPIPMNSLKVMQVYKLFIFHIENSLVAKLLCNSRCHCPYI